MRDFDLGAVQASFAGMDSFFESESRLTTPLPEQTSPLMASEGPKAVPEVKTAGTKVTSLTQLNGFIRTASDTLVHRSSQDLWSLQMGDDGAYTIERKFDGAGGPIKG